MNIALRNITKRFGKTVAKRVGDQFIDNQAHGHGGADVQKNRRGLDFQPDSVGQAAIGTVERCQQLAQNRGRRRVRLAGQHHDGPVRPSRR